MGVILEILEGDGTSSVLQVPNNAPEQEIVLTQPDTQTVINTTDSVIIEQLMGAQGPDGVAAVCVEGKGLYPNRPNLPAVTFVGPDNPADLGLMQDGDVWINNGVGTYQTYGHFVVGTTNPNFTEPGVWVQTGMGANGQDWTFWIEDGQ